MADISAGKYITARNKAEALLRESPDSPGANFVMGQVFWEGEGNLLRAMVLMKKAISLFEEKYCQTEDGRPALADNRTWHQRMMLDLAQIPFRAKDRDDSYPILLAGGPCSVNPEPFADFFDIILVGEGEEADIAILKVVTEIQGHGEG